MTDFISEIKDPSFLTKLLCCNDAKNHAYFLIEVLQEMGYTTKLVGIYDDGAHISASKHGKKTATLCFDRDKTSVSLFTKIEIKATEDGLYALGGISTVVVANRFTVSPIISNGKTHQLSFGKSTIYSLTDKAYTRMALTLLFHHIKAQVSQIQKYLDIGGYVQVNQN